MSIVQSLPATEKSAPPAAPATKPSRPLRLWPAIVALALFWCFVMAVTYVEMAMFPRFVQRSIAHLVLLLFFLGWWGLCRHFSLWDRLLAVAIVLATSISAALITDKSVNLGVLWMIGLPYVFTLGTIWLALNRKRSLRWKKVGFAAINLLVFGCLALVRWDGLDGRQRPAYTWRWTPTAEEQFLASTAPRERASTSPSVTATKEWEQQPGDWPSFRGGEREGVVAGIELGDWQTRSPGLVWRKRIGPGWSSMIVVDRFLVTQEQRGESEAVVCYDAASGKEVWVHSDQARFSEGLSGAGPRGTPSFGGGRIFALGAQGRLNCLSAADGHVLWSKEIIAETDATIPQWGLSGSPLLVDDLVVVFAGGSDGRSLLAFRADSGERAWACGGGKQSYASPQVLTIDGVRQIVMHDERALFAVNPENGAILWERLNPNEMLLPMLQPHLVGNNELVVAEDIGIAFLRVVSEQGKWTITERWVSTRLKPSFNDFLIHQGHIYGLDDGILCCLDLATGDRVWKKGRYGFGQLLLLPDQNELVVLSEKGAVVRVAADPAKHTEISQFQAIQGKSWNHPIIAHGRLFVRNGEEMACFELLWGSAGR